MNRHKNREKAMIAVYQNLVFPREYEDLIANNFSETEQKEDEYILQVVRTSMENTERYAGYINRVLKDWTFDRLGLVEQAILLNGCAEFDLKQVEAPVIIDEYVQLAKEYCDADSYKLINGVLDKI